MLAEFIKHLQRSSAAERQGVTLSRHFVSQDMSRVCLDAPYWSALLYTKHTTELSAALEARVSLLPQCPQVWTAALPK